MGPPEEVPIPAGLEETELFSKGEVGEDVNWVEDGGRVSHERVRRQDWRIMENDDPKGSWVEV